MLTETMAREAIDTIAPLFRRYPHEAAGRGIVIPAGGLGYFTCAWVCIRMLRELGCNLPIEVWHLGASEMTAAMRQLLEPFSVTFVDAHLVRQQQPVRILNGWELKPFAILNSRFREVLLLDADNVPVVDPSFLFETPEYRANGAVFWPDFGRLGPDRLIWDLAGVPYRDEPEFETGQIVLDRMRCWEGLLLTMWMNEHSDFWYRHVHGDKETFHIAFRKLNVPYVMPTTPILALAGVMCQHDFSGRRIFQHRNLAKWSLEDDNPRVPGFVHEDVCLRFLEELRVQWQDRPSAPYRDAKADPVRRELARKLCAVRWLYRRIGFDQRPMTFDLNGRVGEGAAGCERSWDLRPQDGTHQLVLSGRDGVTCILRPHESGRWTGWWRLHECMEVELTPISDRFPSGDVR